MYKINMRGENVFSSRFFSDFFFLVFLQTEVWTHTTAIGSIEQVLQNTAKLTYSAPMAYSYIIFTANTNIDTVFMLLPSFLLRLCLLFLFFPCLLVLVLLLRFFCLSSFSFCVSNTAIDT